MKQSNYCFDGRTAVCTGVEWIAKARDSSKLFLVSAACKNGNVVFGSPRKEKNKYMVQACIVSKEILK